MQNDKLDTMYKQQRDFNTMLRSDRGYPSYPLDLKEKQNQLFLKNLAHECMHELFEANHLLKNSKNHRVTEIKEFDRESYKEELVDALHYFFSIVIYSGITVDELYEAYIKKGEINVQRLKTGY